jgi:hypothetical protein
MKLCKNCKKAFWPYLMILVIAGVAGFLTWMTLSLSGVADQQGLLISVIVSLTVGATLLHYVVSCLRRHCQEWGHQHQAQKS